MTDKSAGKSEGIGSSLSGYVQSLKKVPISSKRIDIELNERPYINIGFNRFLLTIFHHYDPWNY